MSVEFALLERVGTNAALYHGLQEKLRVGQKSTETSTPGGSANKGKRRLEREESDSDDDQAKRARKGS